MIKAKLTNGDLVFGLSKENITRLQKGQPILFNLKEMGLEDRNVIICFGETENDIFHELKKNFSFEGTKIHIKNQEN